MAIRLHEIGKKYNLTSKELATLFGKLGFQVKEHPFTSVSEDMIQALEKHFAMQSQPQTTTTPDIPKQPSKTPSKPDEAKALPPKIERPTSDVKPEIPTVLPSKIDRQNQPGKPLIVEMPAKSTSIPFIQSDAKILKPVIVVIC